MQQENQMLYGGGGSSGGAGGGLSRFRSAPATWFDTQLEEDEHQQHPQPQPQPQPHQPPTPTPTPPPPPQVHQTQCLPQLANLRNSSNIYDPTSLFDSPFTRHNSSPPQLFASLSLPLSVGSEDYFSTPGVSSSYDILSCLDIPTSTDRPAESDSPQASQSVKGEPGGGFTDMEMDKLFQDSVPCRVRAKRGCATHPRSIAERVRRTRISDRIRKLQDLVPNMDKQTNTADMLDEAVEYVKLLQKQIQELTENQKKCKCLARE